jgi:hypothetical protein
MFMETKRINISKIIYMIVVLRAKEVTKNMSKGLKCPYGIPENQCCQEPNCPIWVVRQKRSNK